MGSLGAHFGSKLRSTKGLSYGHSVEYMNMYAMNMQLTAVVGAASVT